MKKLILICLFSIVCLNSLFAQNNGEQKLTKAEILQAQQLAAKFYNRYTQTQAVEPLIKEFFIKDYVKIIRATVEDDENPLLFKISSKDIQRFYTSFANYFFLYLRTYKHFEILLGNDSEKKADKLINPELKKLLKQSPELLKFSDFSYDKILSVADEQKTISSYHKELA